jgi:sRNA-binding protein
MTQGDAVWAFSPAWRGVAFRAGRTDHDGNPGEWLIEDLESIARRWEAEEAARVQRQKEWLERRVRDARSSGKSKLKSGTHARSASSSEAAQQSVT